MNTDDINIQAEMEKRLNQLPRPVRDAIVSADVEKHLRSLADSHKLHLDQWQVFENEVMFTLLGLQRPEDLEESIRTQVGVSAEEARSLASDANTMVFEPIREELERQLSHPQAQEKQYSDIETARNAELQTGNDGEAAHAPATDPTPVVATTGVQPATPPSLAPDVKVTRPTESSTYKPGETSAQRAEVHEDPYREPPV